MTIRSHDDPGQAGVGTTRSDGKWLPADPQYIKIYVDNILHTSKQRHVPRSPAVRALENAVNTDPALFMLFNQMFDESPQKLPLDSANKPGLSDLPSLWSALEAIISSPPTFRPAPYGGWAANVVGLPILALLVYPISTKAGFAAFANAEVNSHFKAILDEWATYLSSSDSATQSIAEWVDIIGGIERLNEDYIVPDLNNHVNYGFHSWDAFFTRPLRPGKRPVGDPHDDSIIVSACESQPYDIQSNVQLTDGFWLKGQRYSLEHMLNWNEHAKYFRGGTVFQAFLSAGNYHRWHVPLSGTIKHMEIVPGTYYSTPTADHLEPPDDHQTILKSQAYLATAAARGYVIMNADNPDIGVIALVFIGMGDVSSVDFSDTKVGQHFNKGDELGMFHYGGSTYCLLLSPRVKVKWFVDQPDPRHPENTPDGKGTVLLNEPLAKVERNTSAFSHPVLGLQQADEYLQSLAREK